MEPATSIRKRGFRKWYERQLIDSHVALTACLLAGFSVAAIVEEVSFVEFGARGVLLMAALAGMIVLGWHCWRRYITVLERAERYGQRSICPGCQCYGRFEVLASGTERGDPPADPPLPGVWMRVQCRSCGTTWRMP